MGLGGTKSTEQVVVTATPSVCAIGQQELSHSQAPISVSYKVTWSCVKLWSPDCLLQATYGALSQVSETRLENSDVSPLRLALSLDQAYPRLSSGPYLH